jgi:hypothetical protein
MKLINGYFPEAINVEHIKRVYVKYTSEHVNRELKLSYEVFADVGSDAPIRLTKTFSNEDEAIRKLDNIVEWLNGENQ